MLLSGTRSIRNKLLLVVLAATFAALVVAGAAMAIYDIRTYQRTWVENLTTQAEILGRASAPALAFDDAKSAREYLLLLKATPKISAAAIYNSKGRLFASYASSEVSSPEFPKLPELDGYRIEGDRSVLFKRIVENNEILGTVYLRARYELPERLKDFLGILGAVMVLSLLVAASMSAWLQTAVTKPILAITEVAHQVMERRDFTLRARKTTEDEIGYLVETFNDMLAEVGRRSEALETSNRLLEHEIAQRQNADDELRRLNAELEKRVADRTAQLESANKELESFSYSVAHDLRSPLRAIDGYSQMLEEDYTSVLDDEGRRLLTVVRSSSRKMAALIDDLLAFSRLGRQPLTIVDFDMDAIVREALKELPATPGSRPPDWRIGRLPQARGDRALVRQVWINLLSNAAKFSGGREQPTMEIGGYPDGDKNVYYIQDNGAGFDMQYYDKLFGVFQRLHSAEEFPGTGVGLAIVQRVVVRQGGRAWAEGELDKGATFYFSLPKGGQNV